MVMLKATQFHGNPFNHHQQDVKNLYSNRSFAIQLHDELEYYFYRKFYDINQLD